MQRSNEDNSVRSIGASAIDDIHVRKAMALMQYQSLHKLRFASFLFQIKNRRIFHQSTEQISRPCIRKPPWETSQWQWVAFTLHLRGSNASQNRRHPRTLFYTSTAGGLALGKEDDHCVKDPIPSNRAVWNAPESGRMMGPETSAACHGAYFRCFRFMEDVVTNTIIACAPCNFGSLGTFKQSTLTWSRLCSQIGKYWWSSRCGLQNIGIRCQDVLCG